MDQAFCYCKNWKFDKMCTHWGEVDLGAVLALTGGRGLKGGYRRIARDQDVPRNSFREQITDFTAADRTLSGINYRSSNFQALLLTAGEITKGQSV